MDEIYANYYLKCICNRITDGHMHPAHVMSRQCYHCGSQQTQRINKNSGNESPLVPSACGATCPCQYKQCGLSAKNSVHIRKSQPGYHQYAAPPELI